MNMLSSQCDELRRKAGRLDRASVFLVDCEVLLPEGWPKNAMDNASEAMREAADTIESLRDRLQESYGQVPEQEKHDDEGERESYDAGFSNGVKACLQQLDGLILEGADVDEIQAGVDEQWEEEVV